MIEIEDRERMIEIEACEREYTEINQFISCGSWDCSDTMTIMYIIADEDYIMNRESWYWYEMKCMNAEWIDKVVTI